jgi:hypothetical protein
MAHKTAKGHELLCAWDCGPATARAEYSRIVLALVKTLGELGYNANQVARATDGLLVSAGTLVAPERRKEL